MNNLENIIKYNDECVNKFISLVTPEMKNGLSSIYNDTRNNNKNRKTILREFQKNLSNIPKWSQQMVEDEYNRIKILSKCDYFDKLITNIFKSYFKVLFILKKKRENLKIPEFCNVIHQSYISIAREIWKKPNLFYHKYDKKTIQLNHNEINNTIKLGIKLAIKNLLPFNDILDNYLLDDDLDSDDDYDDFAEHENIFKQNKSNDLQDFTLEGNLLNDNDKSNLDNDSDNEDNEELIKDADNGEGLVEDVDNKDDEELIKDTNKEVKDVGNENEEGLVEDAENEEGLVEDAENEEGLVEDADNKEELVEDVNNKEELVEDADNKEELVEDADNKEELVEDSQLLIKEFNNNQESIEKSQEVIKELVKESEEPKKIIEESDELIEESNNKIEKLVEGMNNNRIIDDTEDSNKNIKIITDENNNQDDDSNDADDELNSKDSNNSTIEENINILNIDNKIKKRNKREKYENLLGIKLDKKEFKNRKKLRKKLLLESVRNTQ
jgi:hypothetical protein